MSDSKIDPLDPLDKASASGSLHQAGSGPAGMNEAQGQPMGMGMGDEDEISLLDLLLVVSENIRLLILGPIAAGLIALGYSTFLMEPVFTAKTSLIPPSQSASGGAAAALASQFGGLASLAGISLPSSGGATPMAYLQSDLMKDAIIERFGLMARYEAKYRASARAALTGATKISEDKKSGLIVIEVTDKDPAFAAQVANAYVQELQNILEAKAIEDAQTKRTFFEQQLEEISKKPYQSPAVRELMVQSLLRSFEQSRLEEAQGSPKLRQVDFAQTPELKSGPKRALVAVITSLAAGFLLLLLVFVRSAMRNAQDDPESAGKLQRIRQGFRRALIGRT